MTINKRILSTKKLSVTQSELLLATGLSLVHYDVLAIDKVAYDITGVKFEHIIVTSSNAINAIISLDYRVENLFVVGEKTANLLREKGFNIVEQATNAAQLAQIIVNNYSHLSFVYFCGVHRRDELPQALLSTQISFIEVKVYDSVAVEKSFDCIFDAIMFFSPRGVHAFAKANPENIHLAICIGETTAEAARIYTQNVKVAHKTTVENTIVTAVKALQND
ncbi:uroporphyrinogen-III synthase [Nonlabens ulvanivorans]|uniref:uroporphyrinogen-III synthase n=1 Tax=Nonlabens ulvanivorans TaxID=906888 RepID=UPI003297BF8E